jgi:hypothetical protein
VTPVDLADPGARRAWFEAMRATVLDLVAVAEDAAKPRPERFFSRAERRRRIGELERAHLGLLDEAAGSLRPMALVPQAATREPADADEEQGPLSTLRPV